MLDIRWQQRFSNYQKALLQLRNAVELADTRELSDLEKQGLVQAFEYTYELAWNTVKDFYENQGEAGLQGSRDAFRLAFRRGLVQNGEIWMKMIKDRALTTHTYNKNIVESITSDIRNLYFKEFTYLQEQLSRHANDEATDSLENS